MTGDVTILVKEAVKGNKNAYSSPIILKPIHNNKFAHGYKGLSLG